MGGRPCHPRRQESAKLLATVIPPQADGGPGVRQMINPSSSVDIYTEQKFGDCTIELEFMVPKGSNSGVYVMGEYEVQILDSYGKKKVGPGDVGGLYGARRPASMPPGSRANGSNSSWTSGAALQGRQEGGQRPLPQGHAQ